VLAWRAWEAWDRWLGEAVERAQRLSDLSNRSVAAIIATIVALALAGGGLLLGGLVADHEDGVPSAEPPTDLRPVADHNDPRTAGFAGEVVASAVSADDDERERLLRLRATDRGRDEIDAFVRAWRSDLAQALGVPNADDLGLSVATVGQRSLASEKTPSGEIRHLIVVQELWPALSPHGPDGEGMRVLVSLAVYDGPEGLLLDEIEGMGRLAAAGAPLPVAFYPLTGGSP
jgi:hypothetical protein